MRFRPMVNVLMFWFALSVKFGLSTAVAAQKSAPTLALPTPVFEEPPKPSDIVVGRLGTQPGEPIPQKETILFLHTIELELWHTTVANGGDGPLQTDPPFERSFEMLNLYIVPNHDPGDPVISLGYSLYGIQQMLYKMLHPSQPSDGFFGRIWEIVLTRQVAKWKSLAIVNLSLGPVRGLVEGVTTYNSSKYATANTNSPIDSTKADPIFLPPPPQPLSASFPVPNTSITLLIGPRGVSLPLEAVIWALDCLIASSWQKLARIHSIDPVGILSVGDGAGTVEIRVSPRGRGAKVQMTRADVVEAAVGIVYCMLSNGFFVTTVTVVRSDRGGRRIPVGQIEIVDKRPTTELVGSSNSSSETS